MKERKDQPTDYGNWVSRRLLLGTGAPAILLLGLSFVTPWFLIGAAPFVLMFAYFVYAHYQFSPSGGNIQEKIRALVLEHLEWDGQGQALDIGCGNGPQTIQLAKKYPHAHVTGIDYWGGMWAYSKSICEQNAQNAGLGQRVSFQKASASKLPFDDQCFDAAVSNLTFHEVSDAADKRLVIREALRVLRPGGVFSFQDLFLEEKMYGRVDDLLSAVRGWGIGQVDFVQTSHLPMIPRALRLPFMVGTIGILYGRK